MEVGSEELRPGVRAQLEEIAEALNLGVGQSRLNLSFQDGRLHWFEAYRVRAPASMIDELTARVADAVEGAKAAPK